MKKTNLMIMVLSPVILGILFNNFLVLFPLFIFVAPFLMIVYWFFAGTKFAEHVENPVKAVLTANAIGIISLLLYYWQFTIVSDAERSLLIAGFSQMFSAPLSYFSAVIGYLFTESPDEISLAMQVIGLILMIIVFSSGYIYRKNNLRKQVSKSVHAE